MKWPWAVLFIAAMLASCRSSQPTTNPFLRTTVPPPGTAQGMMVMPGEAPPAVVGSPVVTGVPGAAPPGVVPVQPAPMIAPPPPPPQQEFQPPGGSYLFHQSSTQRPAAGPSQAIAAPQTAVVAPPAPERVSGLDSFAEPSGAVRQAEYVERVSTTSAPAAEGNKLVFRARKNLGESRGDPPERVTSVTVGNPSTAGNTIRVVGPASAVPSTSAAPVVSSTRSTTSTTTSSGTASGAPVFRMTVGSGSTPASAGTGQASTGTSTIAIVSRASTTTSSGATPGGSTSATLRP